MKDFNYNLSPDQEITSLKDFSSPDHIVQEFKFDFITFKNAGKISFQKMIAS